MRIAIIGLALLFVGYGRLNAATYFVDYVGGADFNAGTSPEYALKHCPGDPAASATAAMVSLVPGDLVYFKGGVTYVLTGSTGIALNWSGAAGALITYDGNSSGKWGSGRARFTDNYGAQGVTAFTTNSPAHHLAFKSLEFVGIGGAATVPPDLSAALPPRFGGGIAFNAGSDTVTVDGCVFRELGYWFNQKPMNAASLAGTAILSRGARSLTISNSEFACVATACDFSGGTIDSVNITNSSFREAIVWPLNLPTNSSAGSISTVSTGTSTFLDDGFYAATSWKGYGYDPRTELVSVNAGTTVSFAASALAAPAATFQWRRNGVNIPGATGVVLTLNAVSSADAGVYTAVATNSGGSAVSNSAVVMIAGSVTVPVPPAITVQPSDVVAAAYTNASFSVSASGSPAPTYQWQKNGATIPGATGAFLPLNSVFENATYSVVVSNSAGSVVSRNATLTVTGLTPVATAPVFTTQPADAFTTAATSLTLTAAASGTPTPTFQWRRNGIDLPGATSPSYSISYVTANDAGVYNVTASNSAGSVKSRDATVTIGGAPTITSQPVSQTVPAGSAVTFSVVANATPAPYYQWQKNGAPIAGATSDTLRLNAVTTNDAGTYTVAIKNESGYVVSSGAVLTVTEQVTSTPTTTTTTPTTTTTTTTPTTPTAIQRINYTLTLDAYSKKNVGFLIRDTTKTILVRVVGPSLASVGVSGAMPDPQMELMTGLSSVGGNDNWGGSYELMNAFSQAGAMPLMSADSKDSAMLVTVAPGAYNLIIYGAGGVGGAVLVEVYEMP